MIAIDNISLTKGDRITDKTYTLVIYTIHLFYYLKKKQAT